MDPNRQGPGTGDQRKPPQYLGQGPAERVLVDFGPSGQAYGRGVAARVAILAPLIIVNFYSASRSDVSPVIWWGIFAVAAVIALGAVARMIKRVQLTPSSIVVKRLVGAPRTIPRGQVAQGILAQQYQQYGTVPGPLLILTDSNRTKLLYLSGQMFAGSDMYAFAQALGLHGFDVIKDPTTPKEIDQRHPKVLSFMERRPWAFAFIVVGVIIVVVTVALLAAGV